MTDTPATHEPIFNVPPVVQTLCLLNLGIFLLGIFFPQIMNDDLLYKLSFVPARYTGHAPFDLSAITSLVTHMFIHAGWLHLSMNMMTLLAFGSGLEKNMGPRRMLLFYFVSGLCGAALHTLFYPDALNPVVGASGAISGLFGGVIMMMFDAGLMGGAKPGKGFAAYKKLLPVVLLWIGVSVIFGIFGAPGINNPVAWPVHIGGFLSGLVLYKPLLKIRFRG